MKKNETEILEMKSWINQIKYLIESLKNKFNKVEERILEFEDGYFEI
jgi:hypothetical protein